MATRRAGCLCCLGLLLAGTLAGCGGVDVQRQEQESLKLLDLSPRAGEVGVSVDVDVVAVFSDRVRLGEDDANLNERTFQVLDDQGAPLGDVVDLSELDSNQEGTEGGTAVIRLTGLEAGASYTTSIAATLEGVDSAALGVDIQATFRVAD